MSIDKFINFFNEIIQTVTPENQFVLYNTIEDEVRHYHKEGLEGGVLYEFLWNEYPKFQDAEIKQDIIGDIMNKISGHCPINECITFKEIDFNLFDRVSGRFSE